jgi:hypothetical protein
MSEITSRAEGTIMERGRRRIRSLALVPWCIGIIAATPAWAGAQEDTLAAAVAAATEVRVSRREATVTFPASTEPARTSGAIGSSFWRVRINDEGPPRTIGLVMEQSGSFDARVCRPIPPYCDGTRVRANLQGGRVALTIRDSAAVSELFGLRPEVVTALVYRPGMQEAAQRPVRVTYVDPQVPEPDSAFRAAAVEQRRLHTSRVHQAGRVIVSDRPLWLLVGDSVAAQVREGRCRYDACVISIPAIPDAHWSVADSSIAGVRLSEAGAFVQVFALRPGRTLLRVTGMPASDDTLYTLPREVGREVVVTLPVTAVRICPRGNLLTNTPFPLHVEVVDSGGNIFLDPPIKVRMNDSWELTPSDTAEIKFSGGGGRNTFTAAFGGHADTLQVRVTPNRWQWRPPTEAEACSPSALRPIVSPARRPD